MTQAAQERRAREWVLLAEVIAAGVAAGFSGKWEPIQALARQLGAPVPGLRAQDAQPGRFGDLLAHLERRRGARCR